MTHCRMNGMQSAFGDELYSHVEYMNAPQGLILLAHHDDIVGQVDGIHPAALSDSIDRPVNIIEPLAAFDGKLFTRNPVAYNSHWMTRRSLACCQFIGHRVKLIRPCFQILSG